MAAISTSAGALKAAGVIGTWETDVRAGRSRLDGEAVALLAGDTGLAGHPLSLDVALARIHPADRDWVFARIERARRTGGPFSAEFRVLDAAGNVRWILNRGLLSPDRDGVMWGRGVYIDTTDNHRSPFLAAGPDDTRLALSEAAIGCLRVREAVDRSGHGFLRLLVDMLQLEIGRALARRLDS